MMRAGFDKGRLGGANLPEVRSRSDAQDAWNHIMVARVKVGTNPLGLAIILNPCYRAGTAEACGNRYLSNGARRNQLAVHIILTSASMLRR